MVLFHQHEDIINVNLNLLDKLNLKHNIIYYVRGLASVNEPFPFIP